MKNQRHSTICTTLSAILFSLTCFSQTTDETVEIQKLAGPRIGITYINPNIQDQYLDATGNDLSPFISQFGWQFETKFANTGRVSGVFEFIPLIGGVEQHAFLPSLNLIIGMRSSQNFEFGLGPNIGIDGASIVLAGGYNFKSGGMNIPLNSGIVFGREGVRISLLAGFNARR